MITWVVIIAAVGIALAIWRMTSGKGNLPSVGDAAPDFVLPDQNAVSRSLAEFRGNWLVLYFYPRDDTPGCAEEAARFRDSMTELEAAGCKVCGISVDDSASHAAFARKYRLAFPLLADRDGATSERYGSLRDFYILKLAKRNTFLIDPRGLIARVYVGVHPKKHITEVVQDLRQMAAA